MPDLLKLNVRLFSSEGDEMDAAVQDKFRIFLAGYINKNNLQDTTLECLPLMMVSSISQQGTYALDIMLYIIIVILAGAYL